MNRILNRVVAVAAAAGKAALRRRNSAANPGLAVYSNVRNRSLLKLKMPVNWVWSEMLAVRAKPEIMTG